MHALLLKKRHILQQAPDIVNDTIRYAERYGLASETSGDLAFQVEFVDQMGHLAAYKLRDKYRRWK